MARIVEVALRVGGVAAAGVLCAAPGEAAEGARSGMPQLDAATFPSQIFWLIVSFALLYWLLRTKAIPRVADILESRQDRINTDLDRAARLRADAEAALRQHDQVVAEAQAQAQRRVREVQERVAAELAHQQASLDIELARRLHEAETRIGAAKSSAIAQTAEVAAEVVQAASRRLADLDVSPEEARAVVARVSSNAGER